MYPAGRGPGPPPPWTITTLHPDGALTAAGRTGTVPLPADYVAEHVELGYAQTSHATQGRTVDHAHLVLDGPCETRGLYVPLTRGRHSNHAYITTTGNDTPADVFAASLTRTWIDEPAVAHRDRHNARQEALTRSAAAIDDLRGRTATGRTTPTSKIDHRALRCSSRPTSMARTASETHDCESSFQRQHARRPSVAREEPDVGIEL